MTIKSVNDRVLDKNNLKFIRKFSGKKKLFFQQPLSENVTW